MGLLMLAHRSLFWWPVHPVGFLTNGAFLVTAFWFSIFIAWLIKVCVVYVGGQGLYRTARRFFIGVVPGNFAAGGHLGDCGHAGGLDGQLRALPLSRQARHFARSRLPSDGGCCITPAPLGE